MTYQVFQPKDSSFIADLEDEINCIASLSGGIDSTVLAHTLVKEYEDKPLFVYVAYNSKAQWAEIECALKTAQLLDRPFVIIDLSIYKAWDASYLTSTDGEFDEGAQFISEGRNAFLTLIMASLASSINRTTDNKVDNIYLGLNCSDDASITYKDTGRMFVNAVNMLVATSYRDKLAVRAPFLELDMEKYDVIEAGYEFGVEWVNTTHSCSSGNDVCCNYAECESCADRLIVFAEAGFIDPFGIDKGMDADELTHTYIELDAKARISRGDKDVSVLDFADLRNKLKVNYDADNA